MTLLAVRTQFAKISGRYDLVTDFPGDDFSDNGADFFLQAGQDWMDRTFRFPKEVGRVWETVAADTYYIKFLRSRAIQNVWINDDDGRTELEKVDYVQLKNAYDDLVADTDTGTPLYYSPAFIRAIDDTDMNATGTFFNYVVDDSDAYNAIIFLPPPDVAFDVEVKGLFYSDELSVDASTSYWTEVHPMLSVWAGLYMMEISYRNTEGANDWERAIMKQLAGIDMDTVDESLASHKTLQMEG